MKKPEKKTYLSPVPNNPRDNELYVDTKERNREKRFNKDNVLFGSVKTEGRYGYRQTASGRYVERDYPDADTELKQADAISKMMQKRKAALGRELLKSKGAVPVRAASGKKLFEEFCREAYKGRKQSIDDANMRNIYNAANQLNYDKWVWFVNDEYSSRI